MRTSQGQVRPSLPCVDKLPAKLKRPSSDRGKDGRDSSGRFGAGNRISTDRRWKTALGRIIGHDVTDPTMRVIATDAARLSGAILRGLPDDSVLVRANVATLAMHAAVEGYWSAIALDKGLSTPEGQAASKLALEHGLRVERLSVTVTALASKLASTDTHRPAPGLALAVKRLAEMRAQHPVEEPGEVDLTDEEPKP